ncbi:MAG: LamG domain-containing protein [Clostridia bacterium]|nr:LamG domain-containing protein [Clostridia bacterium]MDD4375778.1 LamG domain-containing protein [Clostridia bacterium]
MWKISSGVSIIVLVITMVVILILVRGIISSINKSNIIEKSNEAVFKSDIKNIQQEINLYVNMQEDGNYIYPEKDDIKSASKFDKKTLDIIKGKIVYRNPNDNQRVWLDDLGINSDYTNGLVLDLPLGEYKSGTFMLDKTEYQNNATQNNCTLTTNRFGELNKASNIAGYGGMYVPDNASFSFNSFTISMWLYYRDYTYPKTFGAINKSSGAYTGYNVGWDFGHGYTSEGVDVALNDGTNRMRKTLVFNIGSKPLNLLNKWTHIVYVVDRDENKISAYINGVKQENQIDISSIKGTLTNKSDLRIGTLYGWQTDAAIDDVRIYNRALNDNEITSIHNLHWAD